MTNEKSNASRIIKDVMHYVGINSVTEFANEIGSSYMKVYYTFNGQNNSISSEIITKIHDRFPKISVDYLRGMDVPMCDDPSTSNQPVSTDDMFKLLERMTTMFEKLQSKQDELQREQEKLLALEERIINLIEANQNQLKRSICG